MEKIFIADMQVNMNISSLFALTKKQVLKTKNGDPYLNVELSDRTGKIKGKMWFVNGCEEKWDKCKENKIMQIQGTVQLFQDSLQLSLQEIVPWDGEYTLSHFIPSITGDIEELWQEVLGIVAALHNPFLKKLLLSFFDDKQFKEKYIHAPAAKNLHDNKIGGLLKHSLTLAKLAQGALPLYKELSLDEDLIITAALLHDIGKTEELQWQSSTIDYTGTGRLLGHINLGIMWIQEKILTISDFPRFLSEHLLHLIISHHGRHEYGSNVLPATKEAFFFHALDLLDSSVVGATQMESQDQDWTYSNVWQRWVYTKPTVSSSPPASKQPTKETLPLL